MCVCITRTLSRTIRQRCQPETQGRPQGPPAQPETQGLPQGPPAQQASKAQESLEQLADKKLRDVTDKFPYGTTEAIEKTSVAFGTLARLSDFVAARSWFMVGRMHSLKAAPIPLTSLVQALLSNPDDLIGTFATSDVRNTVAKAESAQQQSSDQSNAAYHNMWVDLAAAFQSHGSRPVPKDEAHWADQVSKRKRVLGRKNPEVLQQECTELHLLEDEDELADKADKPT